MWPSQSEKMNKLDGHVFIKVVNKKVKQMQPWEAADVLITYL